MAAGGNAAGCRLYLVAPERIPDPTGFSEILAAAAGAADIASLVLPCDWPTRDGRRICALAQNHGIAVLVAAALDSVAAFGADGLHLHLAADYPSARGRLGDEAIIGVDCATSRDDAMDVADAGADYVSFTFGGQPDLDLVVSWATFTTVPCVVFSATTPDGAATLAQAGADFVAVEMSWADAAVAAEAVRLYARRIAGVE